MTQAPIRSEVTDRMLIAGPRLLRTVLDEYAAHYNRHRPHRARNLRPPDHDAVAVTAVSDLAAARIRRRRVLGGLINEYQRAALPKIDQPESPSSRAMTQL